MRAELPGYRKEDIEVSVAGDQMTLSGKTESARREEKGSFFRIEISRVVVDTEKGPLSVTESIGVAAFPDDGRDRATLIERADLALYHAKHTGRNRVVTWAEAQAEKTKKAS